MPEQEAPKIIAEETWDETTEDVGAYDLESTDDSVLEAEETKLEKKRNREEKRWFTAIQIAACALILLGMLILKALGGPVYETVHDWYTAHIDDSIIAQEKWSDVLKLPQNDAEAQPSSQADSSAEKLPKESEDSGADVSGTETKPEGPGESGDG